MSERITTRYESVEHLATLGAKTEGSSKRVESGGDFFMSKDWPTAVKIWRSGWKQGGQKLANHLDRIRAEINDAIEVLNRLSFAHKTAGAGVLDMGRWIAGHPLPIFGPLLVGSSPVVKVSVPCIFWAGVTTDEILRVGAVSAAVVDAVTAAGYAVEVNAVAGWEDANHDYRCVETVLKPADRPLDLDDMAFALGHPSYMRRFMFAAGEMMPNARDLRCYLGGSYGGYYSWCGTNLAITAGMGDLDLSTMCDPSIARTIPGLVKVALQAVEAWQTGSGR